MSKSVVVLTLLLALSLLLGACATVAPAAPAEEGAEPVAEAGDKILFWSTEDQPERVERTNAILEAFTAQSGIEVELVPVTEDQLPELLTASAAANTLPDALFFPLDFAIGWAEQGILDYEVAKEIVDELDSATFSQGALDMVTYEGGYAGIPSDGWGQLLIFRKDLFDAAGLETPDTL